MKAPTSSCWTLLHEIPCTKKCTHTLTEWSVSRGSRGALNSSLANGLVCTSLIPFEIDRKKFPKLQRDVRKELAKEPVAFLSYLFRENLPVRNLVDSDFVLANDVTAKYYGLDETFSGFGFVPLHHEREDLGGLLTQASVLSGLSDGREANPVKRGAWFARKMIAEPPAPPPPNVPELEESPDGSLSLRERLELHRNQKGCANCHQGIDPWGLPFEQYNAGGVSIPIRNRSYPACQMGKVCKMSKDLKDYLLSNRSDQVVFSFLKHLSIYAAGRQLGYNELRHLPRARFQSDAYHRVPDD